jgi:hypothetical protein
VGNFVWQHWRVFATNAEMFFEGIDRTWYAKRPGVTVGSGEIHIMEGAKQ